VAAMSEKNYFDILMSPVVTEKSSMLSESNKVVFKVSLKSSKQEIKKSIEALFKVNVKSVNTLRRKGKTTNFKNIKDGSVGYANKGGSMCDTRKKAHEADSCKNCLYGRVRKGANDWCCQKKENCKTDNPHYKKPDGGYICDTRKPKSKNDSCLNCKHGYRRKGLNDWCCQKKEKKNCKQMLPPLFLPGFLKCGLSVIQFSFFLQHQSFNPFLTLPYVQFLHESASYAFFLVSHFDPPSFVYFPFLICLQFFFSFFSVCLLFFSYFSFFKSNFRKLKI
jgi:large subunit ribosomal protein L23